MTTIAVSADQIAGDGFEAWGNEIVRTDVKKIRVDRKAIYASSGPASIFDLLVEWEMSGAKGPAPVMGNDLSWTLLVIRSSGERVSYCSKCPYPSIMPARFAIGSGGDHAMGAMCAGKSPREAIEIVRDNRLDVWTGGTIQVVDIQEVFLRKTVLVKNEKTGRNVVRLEPTG